MEKNRLRQFAGFLWVLPSLLGVGIFIFLPFADVVWGSITEGVSGKFVGLKNYWDVFTNQAFLLAGKNTLRFFAVCIPLLVGISLGIALLLYRQRRFAQGLKSAFLFPMAVPAASAALLWRLLFHPKGLINGWLAGLSLEGPDWMNTDWAFWVLVLCYLWRNLGYDVVLWLAGLSGIPETLYQAAKADGAGEWQCFCYITLPSLLPSLFTIGVLSLLNAFKVFREAYLVAGDYPHESMYLLQHLFNNWYRDLSVDKMAAGAVVSALVICLLVCGLIRFQRNGSELY